MLMLSNLVWVGLGCVIKKWSSGLSLGSAGKGTCLQTWWPEFNPWNSHSGRRELIPASCSVTCTCVLWLMCVYTYMCAHKHTHKHNQCKKEERKEGKKKGKKTERKEGFCLFFIKTLWFQIVLARLPSMEISWICTYNHTQWLVFILWAQLLYRAKLEIKEGWR